jgi:DNA-binding XRE family transcriptional regulator
MHFIVHFSLQNALCNIFVRLLIVIFNVIISQNPIKLNNLTPLEKRQKAHLQELLGQHIRIIRIKKKKQQIDIADKCNFSRSGYNQIENGARNISVFTLYKISKALEVPFENLLKIEEIEEVEAIE